MEEKKPEVIDYYTHEEAMVRAERNSKRWAIACLITFLALVATNVGWIIHEAQYEDIVMTQESTTDGGGDAIINGVAYGDINNGESKADNQN